MRKQATTTRSERQLKFAEAGILFVLILGIALFVGTKMASRNSDNDTALTSTQEAVTEVSLNTEGTDPVIEQGPAESAGSIDPLNETMASVGSDSAAQDLASNPPRVVTYALSERAYFAGEFEEATEMFALYTEEHPGNAWGYYMEGLSNWKAGDPEVAEEAFIAALEIKPDHLKSLINYGRVLLEMDRSDEARIQLEAALAIDPQSVDANRVLGRAYHNLGLLDEAATSYRAALAIKLDDAWSLNNLGLIRIEQERFEEALPPLAKAVQLKQDIACIQNNLGVALERNGYIKDSALAFERALAADQKYAKAEESLERIKALDIGADISVLDLEIVAASFSVDPVQVAESTDSPEGETAPLEETLEVASGENPE